MTTRPIISPSVVGQEERFEILFGNDLDNLEHHLQTLATRPPSDRLIAIKGILLFTKLYSRHLLPHTSVDALTLERIHHMLRPVICSFTLVEVEEIFNSLVAIPGVTS